MLLLPSGSFEGAEWQDLFTSERLSQDVKEDLYLKILQHVGKREGKGVLTHLAVNSGIPLLNSTEGDDQKEEGEKEKENFLRTPTGLKILHGDFGPDLSPTTTPTVQDFNSAFWVSTRQNGITQVWAPRYTMFSRGNVKEKARILDFHQQNLVENSEAKLQRRKSKEVLGKETAVDLYAGIGYFVFSYVKLGMGRVVGFEMNPWSVEGLRRGAVGNGWSVKVVGKGEEWVPGEENITVFLEDNVRALEKLDGVREWLGRVTHVNCGLLPTSDQSWGTALGLLSGDGWLHLHENAGVDDVQARRGAIERILGEKLKEAAIEAEVKAEHVELVKTFAPGVWHCVFDILITR